MDLDSAHAAPGAVICNNTRPTIKGKKRSHSVALPQWMDLDQETLPRRNPVAVVHSTEQNKKTTKATPLTTDSIPATTDRPGTRMATKRPKNLEAFGSVGELTVQQRTSRFVDPNAGYCRTPARAPPFSLPPPRRNENRRHRTRQCTLRHSSGHALMLFSS